MVEKKNKDKQLSIDKIKNKKKQDIKDKINKINKKETSDKKDITDKINKKETSDKINKKHITDKINKKDKLKKKDNIDIVVDNKNNFFNFKKISDINKKFQKKSSKNPDIIEIFGKFVNFL